MRRMAAMCEARRFRGKETPVVGPFDFHRLWPYYGFDEQGYLPTVSHNWYRIGKLTDGTT
jgi:hypothetical protein